MDKTLDAETNRLIGEEQLREYGVYLIDYSSKLSNFSSRLTNDCNLTIRPIQLETTQAEDISILHLVESENSLLSRILASLAALCEETKLLTREAKQYYKTLICYEDNGEESLQATLKVMDILLSLTSFINRSKRVIVLILQQLSALMEKGTYSGNHLSYFPDVLSRLSELLVELLVLDVLASSKTLKQYWISFCKKIKAAIHSTHFNASRKKLNYLNQALYVLEDTVLNGNILKDIYSDEKLMITVKNKYLCNEFTNYINLLLIDLEKEEECSLFNQIWIQVCVLAVFEHNLFGSSDKKNFKRLLDLNKKASACFVLGQIPWYPEKFLLNHIPSLKKTLDERTFQNNRATQITLRNRNLRKEAHSLCSQAYIYMIQIKSLNEKDLSALDSKSLYGVYNMFTESVKLIWKISDLIKWITNQHAHNRKPMSKTVLMIVCKMTEVFKGFQSVFMKNSVRLIYVMFLTLQQLTHKALAVLHNEKRSLMQEKSYKQQQLDIIAALDVCEQALKGPNTNQRMLVGKLALSVSCYYEELIDLWIILNKLEMMYSVLSLLYSLFDCSFLFWHATSLLPAYFGKILESKSDFSAYHMILNALSDCSLTGCEKFYFSVESSLEESLFFPLNQLVETNLRLQTHVHLQLDPADPFRDYFPHNFSKLLPAKVDENYINLKYEAEVYLSRTFYNLTTVVLHDWKTYGVMRRLANFQYKLETIEDNLPTQTLEQGLDLLEIMRNINVFVGKYLYNLNKQMFIEEFTSSKTLNTINVSHVTNSIRTHGIGVMNTTVNFTYQFLQKKFYIFSQFMFDEHIKSRLLKDLRYFSEHKTEFSQVYPYERAKKFNFGIKKLGLNSEGLSYLDLFRKLITHIGNAMGYVRMVRSSGRRSLAEETCFIPDLKSADAFYSHLQLEDFEDSTREAVNRFQNCVTDLIENAEEATEYFRLLVNVFVPAFRNQKNVHLRNFYIIVPPLTINFVEHSLSCKERLNKKYKTDAAFTNDGFAMGLAYIIELLGQSDQLKSLHWIQSVKLKFATDMQQIIEQRSSLNKEDEKLQQTLSLTAKRVNALQKEFELLFYNISSCRMFFQT